jgi:hypothetical protein
VFGFVLIGEALKMLFEQTLEDVDSARPIHPRPFGEAIPAAGKVTTSVAKTSNEVFFSGLPFFEGVSFKCWLAVHPGVFFRRARAPRRGGGAKASSADLNTA